MPACNEAVVDTLPCCAVLEVSRAPRGLVPLAQVLAAGVGKYSMYNFITYKIGEFDAEENAPYLLRARFDGKLLV